MCIGYTVKCQIQETSPEWKVHTPSTRSRTIVKSMYVYSVIYCDAVVAVK